MARRVRHGHRPRRRPGRPRRGSAAAAAPPASAISEPLNPVALRSPVAVRRLAHGSTTVRSGSPARSASGTPAAKAARRASSYSSVASVGAHQTCIPSSERSVLSQWAPEFGRRSPSSVWSIDATRRPIDCAVGADVQDRLRRQPERRQPGRQGSRRRSLAVEPERLDPLDPFADAGQLEVRGRGRGRELDDEHARTLRGDGPSPDRWTVRQQADRTKERSGAGVMGHRSMVQVHRSRYGAGHMTRPQPSCIAS